MQPCPPKHTHYSYLTSHTAAPDDYTAMETLLRFLSGANESCIMIPLNDDFVLENNETFDVALSTADLAVSLDPSFATVTIVDNDG